MRQEHAIMRRDGITPDRKHAAAVLPSWVGWGGGARRQRVDTAGGPARTQATRTRTTVRDIHLFHSQPVTLITTDAISLALTCLHIVAFCSPRRPVCYHDTLSRHHRPLRPGCRAALNAPSMFEAGSARIVPTTCCYSPPYCWCAFIM